MGKAMARVVDAIDIETYLYCASEAEARELAETLAQEMNLTHPSIVFLEHHGWGARVRIRSTIHRPGDHYGWLENKEEAV
jgi:hypothetical protein